MPPGCRMAVALRRRRRLALLLPLPPLLLLLLLPAASLAQSGDGEDVSTEEDLRCISHIAPGNSRLSCELVGCGMDVDDEDAEVHGVQKFTACYINLGEKEVCRKSGSGSIRIQMSPVSPWNVSADCLGRTISKTFDLKKIVKPRSPKVENITLNQDTRQVAIHISTPDHSGYITVSNQLFQVLIWSPTYFTTQNMSRQDFIMRISMDRLQKGTKYDVKVRAIPCYNLQGSWSEWSERSSFEMPEMPREIEPEEQRTVNASVSVGINWLQEICIPVAVCSVLLVAVAVFFSKHKIFTCMCPDIPHPKYTLVHICSVNTGFLMNVKPEVCSALKVCPVDAAGGAAQQELRPPAPADASDSFGSTLSSSGQSFGDSSGVASASTEELELLTQLSGSSSDAEGSVRSSSSGSSSEGGPSPAAGPQLVWRPVTPEDSQGGRPGGQQEEAYVTMSSFYQIK